MTSELIVNTRARYCVTDAARLMGVDRSTVRRWIERGHLRCGFFGHNHRRFVTGEELTRFYNNVKLG